MEKKVIASEMIILMYKTSEWMYGLLIFRLSEMTNLDTKGQPQRIG